MLLTHDKSRVETTALYKDYIYDYTIILKVTGRKIYRKRKNRVKR